MCAQIVQGHGSSQGVFCLFLAGCAAFPLTFGDVRCRVSDPS